MPGLAFPPVGPLVMRGDVLYPGVWTGQTGGAWLHSPNREAVSREDLGGAP